MPIIYDVQELKEFLNTIEMKSPRICFELGELYFDGNGTLDIGYELDQCSHSIVFAEGLCSVPQKDLLFSCTECKSICEVLKARFALGRNVCPSCFEDLKKKFLDEQAQQSAKKVAEEIEKDIIKEVINDDF